jgi:energy-coupling factor transporter ATP-binding protein EcfA2
MDGTRHDEWPDEELSAVAAALGAFRLHLTGGDADSERAALRESIVHHLLPRMLGGEVPLVIGVVGPAGSGKSSLVNSLARARLGPAGAVRPGTRWPVFWTDVPLTPPVERLRRSLGGVVVAGDRRAPDGTIVVDSPPPDVTGPDGMRPVDAILEVADACVFVSSGLRYADAAGWDLLEVVARRHIPAIFVLNKLPDDPGIQRTVREDLARRLAGRGLVARPDAEMVIGIPSTPIVRSFDGPAPDVVAALRKELEAIADPQARLAVAREGVESGLADVARRLESVRRSIAEERRLRHGLSFMAAEAYRLESEELCGAAASGDLLGIRGDSERLEDDLAVATTLRAGRAARAAADAWALHTAGSSILSEHPDLWVHGPATVAAARATAVAWMDTLEDVVLAWSGRGWMRRRRLERLAEMVRRLSVDRDWAPESRWTRRLARYRGAASLARRDLAARLGSVIDADAARFADVLGPGIPDAVLERLGTLAEGSGG